MAQIGFNAGAWDARIWGPAQSYVKKDMDADIKTSHDQDVIASLTIMWGLINTYMPTDIMDRVNGCLDAAKMPRMATRNVGEGRLPIFSLLSVLFNIRTRYWLPAHTW